jgi:putative acetyltransferase
MELLLRPATPADLPKLIDLQTRSINELSTTYYTPEQVKAIVNSQAKARIAPEICLVAESARTLVGFAALLKQPFQISAMFVHPNFARQGIGSQLLAALEKLALQHRYYRLPVMSSLTAVSFYQSQGYQVKHKAGFWTGDRIWIPCILLEKQLGPQPAAEKVAQKYQLVGALLLVLLLGIMIFAPLRRNSAPSSAPQLRTGNVAL